MIGCELQAREIESGSTIGRHRCPPGGRSDLPRPILPSAGFTLLELLVVMALMALVMGFATLYFAGNMSKSKVSTSARELSATLRYGRLLAAEKGEEQRLLINLDSRTFAIVGRAARTIPSDITLTVSDSVRGDIYRGTYEVRLLPTGGVQGGIITLTKGRTVATVVPDPVVGARVVKR
jgi:general secretion pathway protein H